MRRKLKRLVVGLFGVIGANMGRKLIVALRLEVSHHFIERLAGRRSGRIEPPATFRTTKTPKTLLLNPYQLPAHGGQILQAANLDGLSGILQTQTWSLFVRTADFGASFEVSGIALTVGHVSCVAMLAGRSGEVQCKIPYRSLAFGPCILHQVARISRVPVSHTTTGEFIPVSRRFFGFLRLWHARNSKPCSLASGQMPQESQSATRYFYQSPIASTTPFVLTSNTPAGRTI